MEDLLEEGCLGGDGVGGGTEEEEDDDCRGASDGEIDARSIVSAVSVERVAWEVILERGHSLEGPSPRNVVCKRPSEQRADNAGNAVRRANDPREHGPAARRRRVRDEGVCACADARGADAGDGAADDEGLGVGGHTADEAAYFKDEDGEEEGDFQWEVLEGLAPCVSARLAFGEPRGVG